MKIKKRVESVTNQLKPTEAELKILNTEIERETKFNPISSSLAIIARAELSEGPRLQKPIDATVQRYNKLIEKENEKRRALAYMPASNTAKSPY